MKKYELTCLIVPELSEEDAKDISKKISDLIVNLEGTIEKTEEIIRKRLAYIIEKRKEAFLVSTIFSFNPEKLKDLKQEIEKENNIIRHIILNKKDRKEPIRERKEYVKTEKNKTDLDKIDQKIEEILKD
jgi:small subunit ribosomal protein S6